MFVIIFICKFYGISIGRNNSVNSRYVYWLLNYANCYCWNYVTSYYYFQYRTPFTIHVLNILSPGFTKESNKYCSETYETDIGTIETAKTMCLENNECIAIGSRECADDGYYLCKEENGIKDSREGSCIYRKEGNL